MTSPTPAPQSTRVAASGAEEAPDVAAALGRIPSGLFIVTWREGDSDRGMLASWVMQAGFTPPMLTVAVAPSRGLFTAAAAGTPFVVNVLTETQRPLLARFGRPAAPGEDPFAGLAVHRAAGGAPALGEAAAWLECSPVSITAGSDEVRCDHAIVLAHVTRAGTGPDVAPVVHLRKNGLRY